MAAHHHLSGWHAHIHIGLAEYVSEQGANVYSLHDGKKLYRIEFYFPTLPASVDLSRLAFSVAIWFGSIPIASMVFGPGKTVFRETDDASYIESVAKDKEKKLNSETVVTIDNDDARRLHNISFMANAMGLRQMGVKEYK